MLLKKYLTIGIIRKARFFLSSKSLLSLYYKLVYAYLDYHSIAWCSTYPSNLNRILYLQKRFVRIICGAKYLAHTAPLFRTLKVLDIFNINAFFVVCFMYSYHNNLLPHTFNTIFVTNSQVHTLIIVILKMLIITDLISVEQTLNSSQSSIQDLN